MNAAEKEALKELEKFKKDFAKLMSKYPKVIVANDIKGSLCAYLSPDDAYSQVQKVYVN